MKLKWSFNSANNWAHSIRAESERRRWISANKPRHSSEGSSLPWALLWHCNRNTSAVGTDGCRYLGRPGSSCLVTSPAIWRALAIPARAAEEMVRGRGQRGEFPRLQPASQIATRWKPSVLVRALLPLPANGQGKERGKRGGRGWVKDGLRWRAEEEIMTKEWGRGAWADLR